MVDGNDVEITTIESNDIFIDTIEMNEPDPAIVNSENDEESNLSQVGLTWKMVEFELTIVLQNGRKQTHLSQTRQMYDLA